MKGVVITVLKKERGIRMEEYRWVTLTQTAYKAYAAVLAERLRKDAESRGLLPPSQAGFRKGMSIMNHIYVLNNLINKRVAAEKDKMVIMFIDMRAAFDSVDREILIESLRKRSVWEGGDEV